MKFACIRILLVFFASSAICPSQTGKSIQLYPRSGRPQSSTVNLQSIERRAGNVVYQIFRTRNDPPRETFRVNIGFYDKGQLVRDWTYGIILEKDVNRDGTLDYVWYGGDDTGQRLLLFLSNKNQYDCIDVYKSAGAAWEKKFGGVAPDFGEVFGNYGIEKVLWDVPANMLTVTVVTDQQDDSKTHKMRLMIPSSEFVYGKK